MNHVVSVCSLT